MAQFGWNINNYYGSPSSGGGGGLLPLLLLGAVVLAVVSVIGAVVVPAVFAADAFLTALVPLFMWSAIGLGSVALGGGGFWASRNALKTAQINKQNGERYERMRNEARGIRPGVATTRRASLPPKTIYVASTQVGQIERTEVSRSA